MNNLKHIGDFLQKEEFNNELVFSSSDIYDFITPYYKQHLNIVFKLDELMNFLYGYILDRNQFALYIQHNNDILELVVARGDDKAYIQYDNTEQYLVDIYKNGENVQTYNANDEKEVFAILVLKFFK